MAGRPPSGIGFMMRDVLAESGPIYPQELRRRINNIRTQNGIGNIGKGYIDRLVHEAKELGLIRFVGKEPVPEWRRIPGVEGFNFYRYYELSPGAESSRDWATLAKSTASKT